MASSPVASPSLPPLAATPPPAPIPLSAPPSSSPPMPPLSSPPPSTPPPSSPPTPPPISPPPSTPPPSSPPPPQPSNPPPSAPPPSSPPSPQPSNPPPSAPPPSSPPPPQPSTPPPSTPPPSSPPQPQPSTPPPSTPPPSTPPPPPSPNSPAPQTPLINSPPAPATPAWSPPSPTSRSSPPPPTQVSSRSSSSTGVVVGAAVGGVVVMLLVIVVFLLFFRRGKRSRDSQGGAPLTTPTPKDEYHVGQPQIKQHNAPPPEEHALIIPSPPTPPPYSSSGGNGSNYSGSDAPLSQPPLGMALSLTRSTFTYDELMQATEGFSDANLLGQGGFGYVHRGVLRNGKEVAVKQLRSGSGQGDREFQAEVEIISRVHHRHLVSLVGYCIAGDKRLLVYEFVPNNTLDFHLHAKGRPTLEWSTRVKIAVGSARGLAYLHEDCNPKIIHRDIKAANILLDYKFEAKVADFGLAKFNVDNNTHVSTRVMGTFGYLAPEYAASGKLSEKSDVFSFGVMLLELITGRRPVDSTDSFMDDSLVDWARPLLTHALDDGNFDALADPKLLKNYSQEEMMRMVACAAACIRHSAKKRPRLSLVLHALEGNTSLEDLNDGLTPGLSSAYGSHGGSDYDARQYIQDTKRLRKLELGSQEYTSSEFGTTSEYGKDHSASTTEAFTPRADKGEKKKDG